jgi:hypothetical protein
MKIWQSIIHYINSYDIGYTLTNTMILDYINADNKILFNTTLEYYRHLLIAAKYIEYSKDNITVSSKIPANMTMQECKQRILVLTNKIPRKLMLLVDSAQYELIFDAKLNKFCNNKSNILCDVTKTGKQLYVKNDNKYAGFKLVHCND